MIAIRDLDFAYDRREVLRDLVLEVPQGQVVGIIGPNGCGKSTLLRLMRGVLVPSAGEVRVDGRPAHQIPRREMARLAAVVPQAIAASFAYPLRELVAMGRYARTGFFGGLSSADWEAVERAMDWTGTASLAERPVTELSGGELQRAFLARALAQEAPLLLLDEATSNLDLDHRLTVADLIRWLNREAGTTIVQVSHDMDLAAYTSDRLVFLSHRGSILAMGAPSAVLTRENVKAVYGVEVIVEKNPATGTPVVFPLPQGRGAAGV